MTKKELVKQLEQYDDDTIVLFATDSEKNHYYKATLKNYMVYKDEKIGFAKLTNELKKDGYTEEDIINAREIGRLEWIKEVKHRLSEKDNKLTSTYYGIDINEFSKIEIIKIMQENNELFKNTKYVPGLM